MRFWLSAAFSVVLMVHEANGAKITNTSTPVRTNRNGETIVCNQYIGQGVETSDAVKHFVTSLQLNCGDPDPIPKHNYSYTHYKEKHYKENYT